MGKGLSLSFSDQIQRWFADPPPDYVFEVSEYALAAAVSRTPRQQVRQILPERGLTASPSATNILRPQLYRDALAKAAGANGRRQTAALVIPDYAARMAILDFETFPPGEPERLALLRFRMRKSVPFPIDEAQVSYSIQMNQDKQVEVLAVAIATPILREYEAIFVDAGFRVGLVVPSLLAALPLCDKAADGLTLVAKNNGFTFSVLLIERRQIRVIRCLDLGVDAETPAAQGGAETIIPLLQQTCAFSEDHLGEKVKQLLLCGFGEDANLVGATVKRDFGVPFQVLSSSFGNLAPETAGLMGMLEKYAA